MAIGTKSNIQIENEFVHAGWTEVVAGVVERFNAASNNCIRFITEDAVGDFLREDYFAEVSSLVSHRDPTDTNAQTAVPLVENRESKVRVPRKARLVQMTLDAFNRIGMGQDEFNMALGRQLAAAQMQNMFDTAILALDAALDGQTTNEFDASDGTLQIEDLIDGLAKLGDSATNIRTWVQHSKPYYNLMKDHVANAIDGPANMVIIEGNQASLNRPIVVRDASALFRDLTTDIYVTMGLVPNAAVVQLTKPPTVLETLVEGKTNILVSWQAEWDFFLSVKGFTYDEANGAADPSDATLAISTNWDKKATSYKNLAGVHIISQ